MRGKTLAVVAACSMLGFGSGWSVVGMLHPDRDRAFVTAWAYHTDDPKQMARDVDAVVVARFVRVSPGRVAFSSNPSDSVQFELNQFVVEQGWKRFATGETLTLERVAGGGPDGQRVVFDSDGGAYVEGQRYLLFLRKQPDTEIFYLVNDEGRYAVDEHERLVPAARDGKVAQTLRNRALPAVRAQLQSALAERAKRADASSLSHDWSARRSS